MVNTHLTKDRGLWPLLAMAFGGLLLLIALSGVVVRQNTTKIYAEMQANYQSYQESGRALNTLRSQLYTFAILTRDYLLDASEPASGEQRQQLVALHSSMERQLAIIERYMEPANMDAMRRLRQGLADYWQSVDPIFQWTTEEKRARGARFLRYEVLPYRDSVHAIAREIESLIITNLERQQSISEGARSRFERRLAGILLATICLSLVIAAAGTSRMLKLEKRSDALWRQIEQDREEFRSLSSSVVNAQEKERMSISRELHDEVGQMLTALRLELGNLEMLRDCRNSEFEEHMADSKALAERTLRTVRDIAMGLRPSMLDDLGLAPAIEWQAREFTRRTGVPVDVSIEGSVKSLSEPTRTCIYRVIQEALTNCARHAKASEIRVTLQESSDLVSLTIQDDGQGFVPREGNRSLGLLGLEERVRELGGTVSIVSQPQKGTLLRAEIPAGKAVPA